MVKYIIALLILVAVDGQCGNDAFWWTQALPKSGSSGPTYLFHYYSMPTSGSTTATITDQTGNGYTATLTGYGANAPYLPLPQYLSKGSIYFSPGYGIYATISNPNTIPFKSGQSWWFNSWVCYTNAGGNSQVLYGSTDGSKTVQLKMSYTGTLNPNVVPQLYVDGSGQSFGTQSYLNSNVTTMVTWVCTSGNTFTLYTNGVQVSGSLTATVDSSTLTGAWWGGGTGLGYNNGIYGDSGGGSGTITAGQIATLYANGPK